MNSTDGGSQESPWEVYNYEVDMFTQTRGACQMGVYEHHPQHIQNALVESMLLHLRILVEILLSRGTEADDIKLKDLLPKFQSPLIDQLRDLYGTAKLSGSPCWTLNKMLVHGTRRRGGSYDYDPVLKILLPPVVFLLDAIAQEPR